jgi:outer membrane protein OmpA-like peptidoglycan-associated protein
MESDAGPALFVEADNSEQSSSLEVEGGEASPEIVAAQSGIDTESPAVDLPEERQADGFSEPEPDEALQDRPRLAGLAERRIASEDTGLALPDATVVFPQSAPDAAEPEEAAKVPLLDELDRLGYQVTKLDGGKLALNMQEEIPFAVDSATLPANAQPVLTELAEVLARDDGTRVTIVAHTDARGPTEYNRRLSLERAQAVERYLRGRGLSEDNLASLGMGEDVPLPGDGDSPAVHERRIELILEPR